ncbi:hypothetical protein Acsp02_07230 [Actinoplanes sp. NBRC 103695]|nr:hypothetical protein Acsp02_07230 [Actinoplanes sp. NBRC 103695]
MVPVCQVFQPLRYAWRRTFPVTALPVSGLIHLDVIRTDLPYAIVRALTLWVTFGSGRVAAAEAVTTGVVAAAAGCVATSWPAQRQRPRDRAMLPVRNLPRRLEVLWCTVEISLRHACGVSCRVRAGRMPGRVVRLHPKILR